MRTELDSICLQYRAKCFNMLYKYKASSKRRKLMFTSPFRSGAKHTQMGYQSLIGQNNSLNQQKKEKFNQCSKKCDELRAKGAHVDVMIGGM